MKPTFPEIIFVTGIGTGVGKTIVSAVLAEALHADYWKPVQTGVLESVDREIVQNLLSNFESKIITDSLEFLHPFSPHYAASLENKRIELSHFTLPETGRRLVIEGAGGLLVPLNDTHLMADLIKKLNVPVVLVTSSYLGSINHTLLTIEVIKQKQIPFAGIIFNGNPFFDNEKIIDRFAGVSVLGRVAYAETINKEFVLQQAAILKSRLQNSYIL
ncbi:MAG: dethiobiotin synthase [Chitinophagales bacterium]|nr:dethiobiotin synthase [Chitinophagales bacterium]